MIRFYYISVIKVLILTVGFVSGQSPCPDIFEYKSDSSGVYGVITIRPMGYSSHLKLRTNFTIATRLPSNYAGRLHPISSSVNLLQDYNSGVPLQYRVDFPVTSPLPRVTAISVNDHVLCYGPADVPGPNQYVATTSLQHTLFLQGGSPGFFQYDPQPQQPQQKPTNDFDFFNQFPNDGETQIFTFGDTDNRDGSWNMITIPSSRPERPSNQRPSETKPQYYPEVVTQATPPQPPPQFYPEVPARPVPQYPETPARPAPQYSETPARPVPQYPETPARPAPQYPEAPVRPPPRYPEVITQPPTNTPTQKPIMAPASVECGVVAGGNERQPLIFNGQSYTRGEWPWLVAIYKRKDGSLTFICSGTLVSDRHVVTAAHCMQQKNSFSSKKDIVVKVGVYNLEDWGDDITVTRTLQTASIHQEYNASSLANDILVMTFERRVEFNTNIRPACLWSGRVELSRVVGAAGVVAGWGQSEAGGAGRGEPRAVRVPIVSTAACRASRPDFHKLTSENTLCAGDRNGAGPCLGDSGGGLYLLEGGRWRLRGVVSLSLRPDNGDSTCNLNEYIVFTDSAKYLGWIQAVMMST